MQEQYEKLINILRELFQLDQADLDFGIYRILNQKRREIETFLDTRLQAQVMTVLQQSSQGEAGDLKKELDNLENTLRTAGVDVESNAKVQELRAKFDATGNPATMAAEVFNHLASFFRRYYSEGDFISLRRYKKDVYALPYEGEEVKLHWANYDQYYIKTAENFKQYRFRLDDGRTVTFALRDASTERDNNKTQNGKERRFKLVEKDLFTQKDGTLTIWFTYGPAEKKEAQKDLNAAALRTLVEECPAEWSAALLVPKPTPSNKERTLLEKHLTDYTARNTFDYFIHKDLGGFLRRELDFYIKNEVLHLDDINLDRPGQYERALRTVKALKTVALPIIGLLAQIENFQKRLWLKKKLVMQADYCITLDRIPEELYADITGNEEQRKEWVRLFAIDELKGDVATVGYSEPLTVKFLKANPYLLVDTKFFSHEWKYKLLGSINNLDEQCDGLLVNSENFQALGFIEQRYARSIKCIYIDPPYNTDATPIVYKNNYRHSTWLALMYGRLDVTKKLIRTDSVMSIAIDDYELAKISLLIESMFPSHILQRAIVNHYPGSGTGRTNVSRTHEYNLFLLPDEEDLVLGKPSDGGYRERSFRRAGTGENNYRIGRPNSFFAILIDAEKHEIVGLEEPPVSDYVRSDTADGFKRIYPIGEDGSERVWSLSYDGALIALKEGRLRCSPNNTIIRIYNDEESREIMQSVWLNNKFNASVNGTNLLGDILGNSSLFSYPKSLYTVSTAIDSIIQNSDELTLDYFAGSGTTGHAVIYLNREDGGKRKYILVEMGDYFNTVTKPRIQKVVYSEDWKDGKPVSRKGISHCFKYLRLESYEDTLNNLELRSLDAAQQSLLQPQDMADDYLLHYMLEVESRDSLLNLERFRKPFGYKLQVTEYNQLKEQEVDLVETFNYLIGLDVVSMQLIRNTVVVQGRNRKGEKVLVIWRDVDEMDGAALNEFFRKLAINTRDAEFKRIYVNGDNQLENLRTEDEQWKVVLIEEEFHKRMFEEEA